MILLLNPPAAPGGRSHVQGIHHLLHPEQYRSIPLEHLGLMTLKSRLDRRGVPVRVVDGIVGGHVSALQTFAAAKETLRECGPPALVGISVVSHVEEAFTLARLSKRRWPYAPIVLGNNFATLNAERVLATVPEIDAVWRGDAEESFGDVAEQAVASGSLPRTGNLWCRDSRPAFPPAAKDLSLEGPWADRGLLPQVIASGFAAAVHTSRGCPYRCTFCGTGAVSHMEGPYAYRLRDIGDVVEEIVRLRRDFDIPFLTIVDDLFVSRSPRMQARAHAFADEMLARGVDVPFMFDTRVDAIEPGLFRHLAKAGLRRLFVGVETGDERQLRSYRKGYSLDERAVGARLQSLRDLGINVVPGVITFHPAVGPAEIRSTLAVLRASGYRGLNTLQNRIYAYPGTPLHAAYAAAGLLTAEWPAPEWEFLQPRAAATHQAISEFIAHTPAPCFEDAVACLEHLLSEWEHDERSPCGALLPEPIGGVGGVSIHTPSAGESHP